MSNSSTMEASDHEMVSIENNSSNDKEELPEEKPENVTKGQDKFVVENSEFSTDTIENHIENDAKNNTNRRIKISAIIVLVLLFITGVSIAVIYSLMRHNRGNNNVGTTNNHHHHHGHKTGDEENSVDDRDYTLEFVVYSCSETPIGYEIVQFYELNNNKEEFAEFYNNNNGLPLYDDYILSIETESEDPGPFIRVSTSTARILQIGSSIAYFICNGNNQNFKKSKCNKVQLASTTDTYYTLQSDVIDDLRSERKRKIHNNNDEVSCIYSRNIYQNTQILAGITYILPNHAGTIKLNENVIFNDNIMAEYTNCHLIYNNNTKNLLNTSYIDVDTSYKLFEEGQIILNSLDFIGNFSHECMGLLAIKIIDRIENIQQGKNRYFIVESRFTEYFDILNISINDTDVYNVDRIVDNVQHFNIDENIIDTTEITINQIACDTYDENGDIIEENIPESCIPESSNSSLMEYIFNQRKNDSNNSFFFRRPGMLETITNRKSLGFRRTRQLPTRRRLSSNNNNFDNNVDKNIIDDAWDWFKDQSSFNFISSKDIVIYDSDSLYSEGGIDLEMSFKADFDVAFGGSKILKKVKFVIKFELNYETYLILESKCIEEGIDIAECGEYITEEFWNHDKEKTITIHGVPVLIKVYGILTFKFKMNFDANIGFYHGISENKSPTLAFGFEYRDKDTKLIYKNDFDEIKPYNKFEIEYNKVKGTGESSCVNINFLPRLELKLGIEIYETFSFEIDIENQFIFNIKWPHTCETQNPRLQYDLDLEIPFRIKLFIDEPHEDFDFLPNGVITNFHLYTYKKPILNNKKIGFDFIPGLFEACCDNTPSPTPAPTYDCIDTKICTPTDSVDLDNDKWIKKDIQFNSAPQDSIFGSMEISVTVKHKKPSDLVIKLEHEDIGCLLLENVNSGDEYSEKKQIIYTFSDSVDNKPEMLEQEGTYKPQESINTRYSEQLVNGKWTLKIKDNKHSSLRGEYKKWCIEKLCWS